MFLKDDRTGTVGAITFQTADVATAAKFDDFGGGPISNVIQIK